MDITKRRNFVISASKHFPLIGREAAPADNGASVELDITIRLQTERVAILKELVNVKHWRLSKLRAANEVMNQYNPNAGVKQAYPKGRWT
jgi:hypothetical protein